jgi:hypothetical protein
MILWQGKSENYHHCCIEEKLMPSYNEMFKLTLKEVDLIERAVRQQISHLSRLEASNLDKEPEAVDNHKKIIELMHVLGTLHNQKIWYGQKHHTGVPLG